MSDDDNNDNGNDDKPSDDGDLRPKLVALRVAFDDADALVRDMLRRPRRRELGPRLHRQQYREARAKILEILTHLLGDEPPPAAPQGTPVH